MKYSINKIDGKNTVIPATVYVSYESGIKNMIANRHIAC